MACWRFSASDAFPVTSALPVPFLFAGHGGPVSVLSLPPRPRSRRFPARLAAIALPPAPRPKAPLTSFEQAPPTPGAVPGACPQPAASCLSDWFVALSGGRPMGGDCSQKLLPRSGRHSSPGRRSSDHYAIHNSIAKKRMPAVSSLRRSLSPPSPARAVALPARSIFSPLVSGRRYSPFPERSPLARQNGSLTRRPIIPSPSSTNSCLTRGLSLIADFQFRSSTRFHPCLLLVFTGCLR